MVLVPFNLRQHSLCLGQPEDHAHSVVQLDGSGQFGASWLPMADLGVEGAEDAVAVSQERAHAELLGQREGLAVMGFSGLGLRKFALRSNLAEEAQDPCLLASKVALGGERQGTPGELNRLFSSSNQ